MLLPQPRLEEEKKEKRRARLAACFAFLSRLRFLGIRAEGSSWTSRLLSLYQGVFQTLRCSREKPRVLVLSHTKVWARKKLLPRVSPWTLAGVSASDSLALR